MVVIGEVVVAIVGGVVAVVEGVLVVGVVVVVGGVVVGRGRGIGRRRLWWSGRHRRGSGRSTTAKIRSSSITVI